MTAGKGGLTPPSTTISPLLPRLRELGIGIVRFRSMKPRREILNRPVVLLVEDESLVRLTQVEILKDAEFWVVEAQDADEAFDLLKKRPDIAAVLTDVNMPGSIDGFEFARLVHQGWPDVGVLVISGKVAPKPGDLPIGAHFLQKPVRSKDLVEVLKQAMASRPLEA